MNRIIAKYLLQIEAVFLRPNDPFTWSSGIRAPIYCDNRLTLSYPKIRREIATAFKKVINEQFPEVEVVAGTATAGIAHAALVGDLLDVPMCYVRSKAKGHGKGNQIEGKVEQGQKVVVVEDLISTGGSVLTVIEALRNAGCDVVGVVSIFTYELEKGKENLRQANVPVVSLTDFTTLVSVAKEKGLIEEADLEKLSAWRANPLSWEDE